MTCPWVSICMLLVCLLLVVPWAVAQPLDKAALAEEFKAADAATNDGKGLSDKADSGSLGWGEAPVLRNYSSMWLATHDTYWLEKIEDHFNRIMANATDPDGDGFLGWQTTTYSAPVYWCMPLYNRGAATIEPPFFRETGKAGPDVTGHTYLLSFTDAATFQVLDQTAGKPIAEKQPYKSGDSIGVIPGCKVKISGEPTPTDSFMVRTVASEPIEFAVHEGMIAHPVAIFIEEVKKDPKLQERFGKSADAFLAYLTRNMLHKHEQHWMDVSSGPQLTAADGTPVPFIQPAAGPMGAWRFMDLITERYPNRILPHNQYLALARAFLVLKDVPGADPLFGQRGEQMARFFRNSLIPQGEGYVWHYWDYPDAGKWGSSGFEDTSHGHIDIGFAVEAAMRGVVFTDADMKRFTRTVLDLMWNQSEDDPKLGVNVATRGDKHGFVMHDWTDLGRWDPKIYDFALKSFLKKHAATSVPIMLRAESLCARQ